MQKLHLRAALFAVEPLYPEYCATHRTIKRCMTAETRSQRGRDGKETWREAVEETI